MSFLELRKRHKTTLVDHAIRIFCVAGISPSTRQQHIDHLIAGGNIQDVFAALKKRQAPLAATVAQPLSELEHLPGAITLDRLDLKFRAGEQQSVAVTVSNQSAAIWQTQDSALLHLSYHWYNANGEEHHFDGVRTALSEPIAPGCSQTLQMNILPPTEAGDYLLEVSMVMEGRFWCEDRGLCIQRQPVSVELPKLSPRADRIYKDLMAAIAQRQTEAA